jgi:hypothetical protein
MYNHIHSPHERPEHAAWDGMVLHADDPWWQAHMPVKAWGCKCSVIQIDADDARRRGLDVGTAPPERMMTYTNARTGETQQVPAGGDPAFNYPLGGRMDNLGSLLADKIEQAPATLGSAAFKTAMPSLMPLLMQGYTAWVNAIEAGGVKGLGGRRVIGAAAPEVVAGLTRQGVLLASAGLSVEQREITHLFAEERKSGKAVDRSWVYALPERLAKPDAVIHDATPGKEALLYVWKEGDRYVRVVVRPNYNLKGKTFTNAVRSGQVVERGNLQGKYMTLLDGKL